MDWFLYDNGLLHESVKIKSEMFLITAQLLIIIPLLSLAHYLVCTNKINILSLKPGSNRPFIVTNLFLMQAKLSILLKQGSLEPYLQPTVMDKIVETSPSFHGKSSLLLKKFDFYVSCQYWQIFYFGGLGSRLQICKILRFSRYFLFS